MMAAEIVLLRLTRLASGAIPTVVDAELPHERVQKISKQGQNGAKMLRLW